MSEPDNWHDAQALTYGVLSDTFDKRVDVDNTAVPTAGGSCLQYHYQ